MKRHRRGALLLCAAALSRCDASPPSPSPTTLDAAGGEDAAAGEDAARDVVATEAVAPQAFTLTSPAFVNGGVLPVDFTCDGARQSPPLSWSGAPPGTAQFALLMTTQARDGLKWNWVLHSIPGPARGFAANSVGGGVAGLTSDGPALAYAPPCSQGPGPMRYTFTLYALSAAPALPARPNAVTGAVLTQAISSITLARSDVTVTYTR